MPHQSLLYVVCFQNKRILVATKIWALKDISINSEGATRLFIYLSLRWINFEIIVNKSTFISVFLMTNKDKRPVVTSFCRAKEVFLENSLAVAKWKWGKQPLLLKPKKSDSDVVIQNEEKFRFCTKRWAPFSLSRTIILWSMLETLVKSFNILLTTWW